MWRDTLKSEVVSRRSLHLHHQQQSPRPNERNNAMSIKIKTDAEFNEAIDAYGELATTIAASGGRVGFVIGRTHEFFALMDSRPSPNRVAVTCRVEVSNHVPKPTFRPSPQIPCSSLIAICDGRGNKRSPRQIAAFLPRGYG